MSWADELLKEYNLKAPEEETEVQPLVEQPPVQQPPSNISWADKLVQEELGKSPQGPVVETGDGTVKAIETRNNFVDLDEVFEEYGRGLIKEDFLKDDRLMEVVFQNLEARNKPAGLTRAIGREIAGSAGAQGQTIFSGGFGPRDYRKMDREKVFETWQNYQRSFAGGQTVTTANELTYGMSADEDTRSKLGAGYYLFDKMDNAFTGGGSTSEMFDAIGDYTRAGLYDPATFLSFGLGKVLSFGATKASSVAARSLLIKGYQTYIKQGMTKTAARRAVGQAAAKAAPVTVADALFEVAADIGYQKELIVTGAQGEYSLAQTAIAAGGAAFIPALYGGTLLAKELRKSKVLKDTFVGYEKLDSDILDLGFEKAKELLIERVDAKKINVNVKRNFEIKSQKNTDQFLNWEEIKKSSFEGSEDRGELLKENKPINQFINRFFLGDPKEGKVGFRQSLVESGWVVHPTMLEKNRTTGIYAEAVLDFLSDDAAGQAIKAFEKSTGKKLNIEYSAKGIADNFVTDVSDAASALWVPSQLARLDKQGVNAKEALSKLAESLDPENIAVKAAKKVGKKLKKKTKAETEPDKKAFGLSVYKRLITAHLGTTGANLKGFGGLVSLNTASDFATAAINISQSAVYKIGGNAEKSAMYKNRAWGSALGAVRRGVSVLSPELEYAYAVKVLELSPASRKKLFRDVGGDGGVNDTLVHHNIDPKKSPVLKGLDAATKGVQTISLVRMQDELTKTWAFGNNVNQQIMREYGVSPEIFFKRKDASLEMSSDKFKLDVLEKATFRTLRETASVNWSTLEKQSNNSMRAMATEIEKYTNKTRLGYVVPFGSFFNTTMAVAGDLSGINAIRAAIKQSHLKLGGKTIIKKGEIDYATQEGAELFGKAIVGYSAIGLGTYMSGGAIDRISEGLAYNQDRIADGSIEDRTYDWPFSTTRLISQILGHVAGPDRKMDPSTWRWDDVPEDLITELGMQLGGQIVRDVTDLDKIIINYGNDIIKAARDGEGLVGTSLDVTLSVIVPPAMKVIQGATRPLDPLNIAYGLVMGKNMTPDLRQGPENYAKGFRYVNNLFDSMLLGSGSSDIDRKATPSRGFDQKVDVGKQVLGVRGSREVNYIEYMLNSAGMVEWKTLKFDAPPEVKNYMNAVANEYLNQSAIKYLKLNPDFAELSTDKKQTIVRDVVAETKERVGERMKMGELPKTLDMIRVLANQSDDKVKDVMEWMEIEGDLEDIIGTEDALGTLRRIKYYSDNYDSIFNGDLNLKKKN